MIFRLQGCLLVLLFISACSSTQLKQFESLHAQSIVQAKQQKQDDAALLASTQKALQTAHQAGWNLIAPLHLAHAEQALEQAIALQPTPNNTEAISHLLTANTLLANAAKYAQQVERHLEPALTQIRHLEQMGTNTLYPNEYKRQQEEFRRLASLIENDQPREALALQSTLTDSLTRLEKQVLETKHTRLSAQLLESLYSSEADYYAPMAAKTAMQKIADLKSLITHRNRDTKAIEAAEQQAIQALKRAISLGEESKRLVGLNSAEAEQHVAEMFAQLEVPYAQLTKRAPEAIDLALITRNMADEIKQLQARVAKQQAQLTTLKQASTPGTPTVSAQSGERFLPPEEGSIVTLRSLPADNTTPSSHDAPETEVTEQSFDSVETVE